METRPIGKSPGSRLNVNNTCILQGPLRFGNYRTIEPQNIGQSCKGHGAQRSLWMKNLR